MKRIFMLSRQLLFSQGVENLLIDQPGLEIVGRETDVAKAMDKIRVLKPDIVILDSKDMQSVPSMIIAQILKETPDCKVISLNLENDQVHIYHGEQRSAQCVNDLLEAMNGDQPGPGRISSQEWASLADGRAQVYGFLAALYQPSLDEALLENLGAGSTRWIGSLDQEEDLTGDLRGGVAALKRFQQEAANRPKESLRAELAEEYARLLQEGCPGRGAIPACETLYLQMEADCSDVVLAGLDQTYAAGGYPSSGRRLARPDFIACELDFMQVLSAREAQAWRENNHTRALQIQGVERAFLKNHLIGWVPRFCDALLTQTQHDFYQGAASLTKGFILNEAYRVVELMEWISQDEAGEGLDEWGLSLPAVG